MPFKGLIKILTFWTAVVTRGTINAVNAQKMHSRSVHKTIANTAKLNSNFTLGIQLIVSSPSNYTETGSRNDGIRIRKMQ